MEDARPKLLAPVSDFLVGLRVTLWHSVDATAAHTRAHRMAAHNGLNNLSPGCHCLRDLGGFLFRGPDRRRWSRRGRAPRASRRLHNAISPPRFESAFEVVRPGFSIGTQRHNGIEASRTATIHLEFRFKRHFQI